MIKKPNNVVRIPSSLSTNFFKYWFMFLEPCHRLTNREIDVISAFVKKRYELSKVIKDNNILDKVVMSEDVKNQIKEECEISNAHFQVILGKLRKNQVIIDNKINPKFIPNITEGDNMFQLVILFDLQ